MNWLLFSLGTFVYGISGGVLIILMNRVMDYRGKRQIYHKLDEHAWSKGFQNWKSLVGWWCDKGWRDDPKGEILK